MYFQHNFKSHQNCSLLKTNIVYGSAYFHFGPIWNERIKLKEMECKEYFKNMYYILLFVSLSKRE